MTSLLPIASSISYHDSPFSSLLLLLSLSFFILLARLLAWTLSSPPFLFLICGDDLMLSSLSFICVYEGYLSFGVLVERMAKTGRCLVRFASLSFLESEVKGKTRWNK